MRHTIRHLQYMPFSAVGFHLMGVVMFHDHGRQKKVSWLLSWFATLWWPLGLVCTGWLSTIFILCKPWETVLFIVKVKGVYLRAEQIAKKLTIFFSCALRPSLVQPSIAPPKASISHHLLAFSSLLPSLVPSLVPPSMKSTMQAPAARDDTIY